MTTTPFPQWTFSDLQNWMFAFLKIIISEVFNVLLWVILDTMSALQKIYCRLKLWKWSSFKFSRAYKMHIWINLKLLREAKGGTVFSSGCISVAFPLECFLFHCLQRNLLRDYTSNSIELNVWWGTWSLIIVPDSHSFTPFPEPVTTIFLTLIKFTMLVSKCLSHRRYPQGCWCLYWKWVTIL